MGPPDERTAAAIVDRQPWNDLARLVADAGSDPKPVLETLRRYARMLITWNRSVSNLISRNDEARLVERHIRESIEPAAWIKQSGTITCLDFGSGAGLPGIPLAIVLPFTRWTMVESRRPKTLFMTKAIQDIGLRGITVVHGRLESLNAGPEPPAEFDALTSRATIALGPTLSLARSVVREGGSAFLWKGSRRESEMESDPSWREHWRLEGTRVVGTSHNAVVKFVRTNK